jgi:hypothetical protein
MVCVHEGERWDELMKYECIWISRGWSGSNEKENGWAYRRS